MSIWHLSLFWYDIRRGDPGHDPGLRRTFVLYWDKIGEVYKDPHSSKTKQQSPQVGMPDPKKEHIRGYIDGFEDGKQKRDRVKFASAYGVDYCNGYEEGYKHGRGKKKRLYSSADLT